MSQTVVRQKKVKEEDDILTAEKPMLDLSLTFAMFFMFFMSILGLRSRPDGGLYQIGLLVSAFICVGVIVIPACKFFSNVFYKCIATSSSQKKRRNGRKFNDQAWQLFIHLSMSVYGFMFFYQPIMEWYDNTSTAFIGPGAQSEPGIWLDGYYVLQVSIWLYTGVSHRFLEAKHKDYYVMYIHHVVTLGLLAFSWSINSLKFGLMTALLHDVSDIGIDMLKMANYAGLGMDGDYKLPITEVIFISGLLVWIFIRLWVFPTRCLGSVVIRSECDGVCAGYELLCTFFKCLMVVLQVMHIWWTCLLLRILFGGLDKKAGAEHYEGDSDSDSEDADQHAKNE